MKTTKIEAVSNAGERRPSQTAVVWDLRAPMAYVLGLHASAEGAASKDAV